MFLVSTTGTFYVYFRLLSLTRVSWWEWDFQPSSKHQNPGICSLGKVLLITQLLLQICICIGMCRVHVNIRICSICHNPIYIIYHTYRYIKPWMLDPIFFRNTWITRWWFQWSLGRANIPKPNGTRDFRDFRVFLVQGIEPITRRWAFRQKNPWWVGK